MAVDLSQNEWDEQLAKDDNAIVLDVRTEEEVEEGHLPNMQHIDIRQGQGFLDAVEALDKSKNYYVYCRSGARSSQACTLMNQMGFETTYNLEGGIMNYEGPIEQS
ncbi:rhodanese-like domain-containing protein [Aquimarina sp. 2-A2]|uniref:rhodanese-like domain-containing protein n=1 Tax=Aquimarina sp. 2-A2 TaxID=3382644 RepID=UPI00387F2261